MSSSCVVGKCMCFCGCWHSCKCVVLVTYPRSSPPRDSGGRTWRCSGCRRRSVWTWWASVSVKGMHARNGWNKISYYWHYPLYRPSISGGRQDSTKQVLQNMLRSRLPVSASSTIVWRKETRNKSRIKKNKKTKTDRDMAEKWMNNWEIHLAEVYLAVQQKT